MGTHSIKRIDEHLDDLTTCKKLKSDWTQAIRNGVLSTLDSSCPQGFEQLGSS